MPVRTLATSGRWVSSISARGAVRRRRFRGAPLQTWHRSPLFGVGLVLSFGAVADVPDVAVRVGERSAVSTPPQLRRGLEDLPARFVGLVQNLADAVLAAHDVVEDDAAEAAALRAHAHHAGEPVAAVEADQGT